MERLRRHRKSVAWALMALLAVQTIGCASFVPIESNMPDVKDSKIEARLRVHARDQSTYIFPANQYTVRYHPDSTLVLVKGWGDKYTAYGLVDRGYFELTSTQIKNIEIEKMGTGQVVLIASAVVGLSVLTYLGVKVVSADGGGGRGRVEGPAEGN